jgi:hypothetical protein
VTADFNQDGIADIATALGDGTISVLLGKGDGTFNGAISLIAGASAIAVGDFNGDGIVDLPSRTIRTGQSLSFLVRGTALSTPRPPSPSEAL